MINISFVTLVFYNNPIILSKKINSILSQYNKKIELLFILNNHVSKKIKFLKNPSELTLKKYGMNYLINLIGKKNIEIKIILPKTNSLSTSRNLGGNHAKGKVIVFSDEDIVPSNNWVKEILNSINSKNADFVFGKDLPCKTRGLFTSWRMNFELNFSKRNQINKSIFVTKKNFIACAGRNIAMRKNFFKKIKGYDKKYDYFVGEDLDLELKAIENGKVFFNPNMLVSHFHELNFFGLLKKFWISGKSDANWIINNREYLFLSKHFLKYSDFLFIFFLIIFLLFGNILLAIIFYFIFGAYKLINLSNKGFNFKLDFLLLTLILLPLKSIFSSIGFIYQFGVNKYAK